MAEDANVKVFCRVRPPNEREGASAFTGSRSGGGGSGSSLAAFVKKCVIVPASDPLQQTVFLQSRHQSSAPKTFTFDRAFSETATQNDVFQVVGVPITQACLQGYNGTIFAYGQTGSGKTFTMQGPDHVIDLDASRASAHDAALRGLVPRVFDYLFEDGVVDRVAAAASSSSSSATHVQHTFACSFLEIYNERVYDLLDGGSAKDATGLALRENGRKGVFVDGLIESVVTSAAQAAQLMTLGAQNRRVGQTAMNRESSRSHSVFIVQIQSKETTPDGITKVRTSRFNLVDLAGSERQRTTEAAGERLKEAGSINKSLSALGNVIMGLVEQSAGKNRHVHYRDSKLTFLLKDSLGGNSKTFMIATVSPADESAVETLSTLKFAQRAKLIRNNAVINEDATGSVLVLQEEIQRLRRQLHHAQLEHVSMPVAPSALLSTMSTMSAVTPAGARQNTHPSAPCDPAVDMRFRELESAFATTVEKHSALKRSHERMKVQDEHAKALCNELKRQIAHLRLVLRLRGSGADQDEVVDYEPSVDAIEWRLKYDELEESFAELQDEVQRARMAEQLAGAKPRSHVEGEIEQLNLMLLALTKQLAHVVRDKHELQDRLLRLSAPVVDDDSSTNTVDVDMAPAAVVAARLENDRAIAELQDALATQKHELQSHVNAALAARDAAEDKTREASRELLAMKQKQAAWQIQDTEREIRLVDAERRLRQAEDARVRSDTLLQQTKQQHAEQLTRADRAHATARLALEAQVADLGTTHEMLQRQYDSLRAEAAALRDARTTLEQQAAELTASCATLTSQLTSADAVSRDQLVAIESLQRALAGAEMKLADAVVTIREREQCVSELRREVADVSGTRTVLEQQLEATSRDLDELRVQQQATQRELAQSKADVTRLTAQSSSLEQQLCESDAALTDTRNTARELTERLADSARELAALETVSASARQQAEQKLEAQQRASESALAAARQELAAMSDAHSSELQRMREAADARIEQLVASHEAALAVSAEQLAALQREHAEQLQAAANDAEALRAELEQQLAARDSELATTHTRAEQLARELSDLEAQRDAAVASTRRLESASAEQQRNLAARDTVIAELHAAQTQLTAARDTLRTEVQQHAATIATLEDANTALTNTVAAHSATSTELTAEREALTQRLRDAQARAQQLSDELATTQQQRDDAAHNHDAALAALNAAHADALATADATADSAVAELRAELAVSRDTVETQRREYTALEQTLQMLTDDAAAAAKAAAAQLQSAQMRADDAERTVRTQLAELRAYVTSTEALKSEAQTLQKLGATQRADHDAAVKTLRARVSELEQQISALSASRAAADAQREALQMELEQMTRESATQLATATREVETLRTAQRELVTQVEALSDENRLLARERESQADLAALADKIARQSERVAAEQRVVERERAAAAAVREQLTCVTSERDACQARLDELEPRVAQLMRDRSRLESDAQAASARLASVSRDNDKLVGQSNKRQKIQYHFRVKEENNRLLGEVRQLTDDKFRLETKIEKLRRALKDRESGGAGTGGAGVAGLTKRPSASSVSSSNSMSSSSASTKIGTNKVSSSGSNAAATRAVPVTKKLIPVVSSSGLGGLENSSLAPTDRMTSKKRQHSRIERA